MRQVSQDGMLPVNEKQSLRCNTASTTTLQTRTLFFSVVLLKGVFL